MAKYKDFFTVNSKECKGCQTFLTGLLVWFFTLITYISSLPWQQFCSCFASIGGNPGTLNSTMFYTLTTLFMIVLSPMALLKHTFYDYNFFFSSFLPCRNKIKVLFDFELLLWLGGAALMDSQFDESWFMKLDCWSGPKNLKIYIFISNLY